MTVPAQWINHAFKGRCDPLARGPPLTLVTPHIKFGEVEQFCHNDNTFVSHESLAMPIEV